MNRYLLKNFIGAVFLLLMGSNVARPQNNSAQWNPKTAKRWVKSREWSNGLKLKVNSSVDKVEFAKQYHVNKAYWDKAFIFMRDGKLDSIAPGKYAIDGDNVYAIITKGPEKDFDKSAWESHRRYIDLHYVIKGKEKMGVSPIAGSTVIKPYDETKDAANYTATGKFYVATPSEFFLFFPNDVHRPNIKVPGYDTVKKLVIKIRVAN